MELFVRISAPAKINLHLEVHGKRPDGFHSLLSLFQAVDLCDEISIRSLKEQNIIEITGDFDCLPEDTTVYKAVSAFRDVTGNRTGVAIQVDKRIPAGAGLGGGSSDGAAVLKALDSLFGTGIATDRLEAMGSCIGSDVPFFVRGGISIVSGRGECLEPIQPRTDYGIVLVFPGFGVRTSKAFERLDSARSLGTTERGLSPKNLVAAYYRDLESWPFFNSFEPVVGQDHPEIGRIVTALRKSGASFASMTGSGSTVFGVFSDFERALSAQAVLAAPSGALTGRIGEVRSLVVVAARPLASTPAVVYA